MTQQITDQTTLRRLKSEIGKWRSNKTSQKMPEWLWEKAAQQARIQGIHRVCQQTQLNYANLRQRMISGSDISRSQLRGSPGPEFVEVSIPALAESTPSRKESPIEVQWSPRHGGSVRITFTEGASIDWDRLFCAWNRAESLSLQKGSPS
jgi:hypothetical protein